MKLPVLNVEGRRLRQITVDDSVFGISPNVGVVHQAFLAQRANQRRGAASTKSRGEVQGSSRKIRSQKYTGRARQGSARSPVRVGGGAAFGPRPRSFSQDLPKKMRRLAIRSALSAKLADGQLRVIDKLKFDQPRTKEMVRVLRNVGIERSALIITDEPDRFVLVSARNLQKTKVLPAAYLNVLDMVVHRDLLLTEQAVRKVEGLWATSAPDKVETEPKKPVRRARRKQETTEVEEPKVASRARRPKGVVKEADRPSASAETASGTVDKKPTRRTKRSEADAETIAEPSEKPRAARRRSPARKEDA